MPGNGYTLGYTGIHTLEHTIRVCEGGGGGGGGGVGDKVVGMQLYIHKAMCMCVW